MSDINFSLVKTVFIKTIKQILNPNYNEKIQYKSLNLDENKLLFELFKKHDLAHLVAVALQKDEVCEELFTKYRELNVMAIMRYEQLIYDYDEIVSTFNSEGIPFIPLKGLVIRDYYNEPWHRTSCDIDILVQEKDLKRAMNALVRLNSYTTDEKIGYHDVSLYSPSKTHLELHFNIFEDIEEIDKLLKRVWDYSFLKEDSLCEYRQSKEFLIFHLVAHMMYHFINGGCGVRSIMDMWVLHNKLNIDKTFLNSFLKECNLVKFYDSLMELCNVWFNNQKYSEKTLKMEHYILSGGVYGSFQNKMKVTSVKAKGKGSYVLKRIFCPYSIMKNKYPILKKHKWLLPFFEVVRWVETIFKGKAKNLKKETKEINSTTDTEKNEFKNFLTEIGL